MHEPLVRPPSLYFLTTHMQIKHKPWCKRSTLMIWEVTFHQIPLNWLDLLEVYSCQLSEEHTYITWMIQILLAANQYEECDLFKLKVEVISKSVIHWSQSFKWISLVVNPHHSVRVWTAVIYPAQTSFSFHANTI